LHDTLNIEPIAVIIHRLKAKFFAHSPHTPTHWVQQIGNYAVIDLTTMYKKYKRKRLKRILL